MEVHPADLEAFARHEDTVGQGIGGVVAVAGTQPGKDHVAGAVDEVIEPIPAGALVGDGEIELTPGGGDGPQVAVEVGPVAGFDGVKVEGLIRAVRPCLLYTSDAADD